MSAVLSPVQLRALAFSGVCHAAHVVGEIAHGRRSEPPRYLVDAIYTQALDSVADVFTPLSDYRPAMGAAADLLSGKRVTPEQARYVAQLLKLSGLLRQDRAMVDRLRNLLDAASSGSLEDRIRSAADIYRDTISKLGTRIQVTGSPEVLQRPGSAEQIRCMLLAGIRFAWAWEQLGGRQWQLLLQRGSLIKALGQLAVE